MKIPTKEEYFKKKAEEHAREYRTFFEGLSDWEIEFIKEYEGIDGHSGLYAQGLLQMVSERVKKAHQAGYEEGEKKAASDIFKKWVNVGDKHYEFNKWLHELVWSLSNILKQNEK